MLMDVQMPEMDGLEATKAIRERERQTGAHVPIVAMTAHAMKGDRERCLSAGMDGYVAKPVRARELYDTMSQFFNHSPSSVPEPTTPPVERTSLDWSRAHAIGVQGGSRVAQRAFADAFLTECPTLMEEVRQAVAKEDATMLRRPAHTIKGSTLYFGAALPFPLAAIDWR